jgi:hypothetical protein
MPIENRRLLIMPILRLRDGPNPQAIAASRIVRPRRIAGAAQTLHTLPISAAPRPQDEKEQECGSLWIIHPGAAELRRRRVLDTTAPR